MKTFAGRRRINLLLFACSLAVMVLVHFVLTAALTRTAIVTGWVLLGMVLFLAAYNLRKKIPFLPLLKSSTWLQLHIYIGLLTAFVFFSHVSFRLPNGLFEQFLAGSYLLVFFSGIFGLVVSRVIPSRLTGRGEEVIYERIPSYIAKLSDSAKKNVFEFLSNSESTAIPELYLQQVHPFLAKPAHFWRHLFHSDKPRRELLQSMESQKRFMQDDEREVLDELAGIVRQKDDLDYHYAMQSVLKYWLFLHIPLTYALIVFAIFHAIAVFAFAGGLSIG